MKRLGLLGAAGVALVALAFVVSYFLGGETGAPDPAKTASVPAAGLAKSTVKREAPAASAGQDSPKAPEPPKPAQARPAPKQPAGGAEVAAKPTPVQPAAKPAPAQPAAKPLPAAPPQPAPAIGSVPRGEPAAPKSSAAKAPGTPPATSPPSSAAPPPTARSEPPPAPQAAPAVAPKAPAVATLPPSAAPKASKPPAPGRVGPEPPSFDVVRIEPDGDVVMAGRAPPGWQIIVRDGEREVGRATANARGEWVLLPDRKVAPGSRQFRLTARSPDGRELGADSVVVLVVPERQPPTGAPASAKKPSPPLAVALPEKPGGRARLLQAPTSTPAPEPEPGPKIAIDLIEIEGDGRVAVSGHADAGAVVRVYLNEAVLGDARAGADGVWRLTPEQRIRPGSYTLRADRIGGDGAVLARIEVGFEHGGPVGTWPEGREIIVVRGHTLWWIARRLYGRGEQYTLIFEANRDSIRDPDLIYPGQVFALPRTE